MADMRRERSRGLLRSALLELLDEKPLEKVSVREVVERAGLSKRAFYNNYQCLTDLAIDCYHCLLPHFDELNRSQEGYEDGPEAVVHLADDSARSFAFLRDHPRLAAAIANHLGSSPYLSQAWEAEVAGTARFWERGEREERQSGRSRDLPGAAATVDSRTCAWFIMSGHYGLVRQWVLDGMRENVESLARKDVLLGMQCGSLVRGEAIRPEYLQALEEWRLA